MYDHDLGFLIINSFLKGYEATGNEEYKRIALAAADTLATLFNPTVGTILSWPRHVKDYGGHNTIMDNMINLELLFWADAIKSGKRNEESGERSLYDMAVRHAETTMKNHFREDGSCYHVAVYDTLDGHFIKGVTHQGYADEQMLRDLSTDRYQSRNKNCAFLLHSTGHHPAGSEIDASIIYADYYYIEALLRLKHMQ